MQSLFRVGGITFFRLPKGSITLDPITAINNAIAGLFQFLGTPAGQQICADFRAIDAAFAGKLKDLFDKIHGQIHGTAAAVPAVPAPKV